MILKFMNNGQYQTGWEMMDYISSLKYSSITKEQRQEANLYVNYYIQLLDKDGRVEETVENYKYIQIWNNKNTDEPFCIVTNMPVYLLNDEGKTIEKISY